MLVISQKVQIASIARSVFPMSLERGNFLSHRFVSSGRSKAVE
jgi:hypothetical protein